LTLNYQSSNLQCRCKIHSRLRPNKRNCNNITLHVTTLPWSETHSALQQRSLQLQNSLHECLFEYEQSKPDVRLECRTPKVATPKQQLSKIPTTLEQRRSQRFCASAFSITRFRALQVCACSVAQPGLSDRSNKGVKFTRP